jgi:hypothetical protein
MQKSDQNMTIHDSDHSSPTSATVKNECSHANNPTYTFMACTRRIYFHCYDIHRHGNNFSRTQTWHAYDSNDGYLLGVSNQVVQFHKKVGQMLTNAISSLHIHSCICPSADTANGHSWSFELHLAQFKPSTALTVTITHFFHTTHKLLHPTYL